MKTNRVLLVATALFLAAAAITSAASPMMGTWKLNEAKSKFSPDAAKNDTVTYTAAEGDMIKVTVNGMTKDGKRSHWTSTVKFDGQPYKVKGNPMFDTVVYQAVNERTNKLTLMKGSKTAVTGTVAVSKDGKSRVVTNNYTDAQGKRHTDKAYYDKQ